ncbi:MAG: uroporphyrinogen decarboxylase family protein [Spirochaetota bacterium]
MTSRERVLKTLNHQEPDRVPLDMGATIMSGIMAHALNRLYKYLGFKGKKVRVYEVFQMLGEVEWDIIDYFGIDLLPVELPVQFFGLRRENYKPWQLWDGTEVLVPGQFDVEIDAEGNWLIHNEGDINQPVKGKMPKNGYYFDMASVTDMHPNYTPPSLDEIKKENHLTTVELEFLQGRAEDLRKNTDKALVLGVWGRVGLPWVGSIPDFLCLMLQDKAYVRDVFQIRTETAIKNMEKLKKYLGSNIDILGLDGTDYGSQNGELFNPELFGELFVTFLKQQNEWIHKNTGWKTWLHTCGSVTKVIPMLIETGLDILNPVQTSASGMEPAWLKKEFGGKLTFWGGGVDTQKTLPFGSVDDVRKEVSERIKIFAPGGGFIFNSIHNIQQGAPPENIATAYTTAREIGVYPIAVN